MMMRLSRALISLWLLVAISAAAADHSKPLWGPDLVKMPGGDAKTWTVSALYVVKKTSHYPEMIVATSGKTYKLKAKLLDHVLDYAAIAYEMHITREFLERRVAYYIEGTEVNSFFVPALGLAAGEGRLVYHSCNGYQYDADKIAVNGIDGIWHNIYARHEIHPIYLQIGGGDQIYADGIPGQGNEPHVGDVHGVMAVPSIREWLLKDMTKEQKKNAPFTRQMEEDLIKFYFNQYKSHYSTKFFAKVNASIPSTRMIDDHDILDGFGSYPDYFQNSNVIKGLGAVALKFIHLFQHHLARNEMPVFGERGYHFMHDLDKVALIGIDMRSMRTPNRVMDDRSWQTLSDYLQSVNDHTKHVMLMVGVPVVYPSSKAVDTLLDVAVKTPIIGNIACWFCPTLKNEAGEPELSDDFRDSMGHAAHKKERDEKLIDPLLTYSLETGRRVTILSGDVHVGGLGVIDGPAKIYNVISSPVGNKPLGRTLADGIGASCQGKRIGKACTMSLVCMHDKNNCCDEVPYLHNGRNYAVLGIDREGNLQYQLSVEQNGDDKPHTIYKSTIPKFD